MPCPKTIPLTCRGLCVGYNGRAVLEGIDLEFGVGQFISLLGPNGAGKTTLLRTLSRHLAPVRGSIRVMGRSLAELRQMELARTMAVVLTERVAPPLFSAFQFVALGRYPYTGFLGRLQKRDQEIVHRALEAVHARDLAEREFASLSDGERQKVLVARALAQEPAILLLDEPTAHLDLRHRLEVMAILRDLCRSQGITVLASLHDVDIAAKVSDQVILVRDGAVTDQGSPEEVLCQENVARLYDLDQACFSSRLGSIELRSIPDREPVFVVAGSGSGARIFRMLARHGHAVATGILLNNDLDFFVAQSLGIRCVSRPLTGQDSQEALAAAKRLLQECTLVIDAGGILQGPCQDNLELLEFALELDLPVLSLRRERTELQHLEPVIDHCRDVSELMEKMEASR
ncbi:ABC transporter ATP-binding protein [Desulfolithobacter sp.]